MLEDTFACWSMFCKCTVLAAALVALLQTGVVDSACSSSSGPSGSLDCFQLPNYVGKQWLTCVTDTYMQQISKGKHGCVDRSTIYCYYQCMLALHNVTSGTVTPDCSCEQQVTTTIGPPVTTLDPFCYSPSGDSCSWYRDCLERKIPCSGGQDGYAIEYAKKFCNKFDEQKFLLSQQGQQWMEAARRCLQISMVRALRPFSPQTCTTVKQLAFSAHLGCYLTPFQGQSSFCDLPIKDMFSIFWIIKGAFVTEFEETLLGLYQVMKQCLLDKYKSAMVYSSTKLMTVKVYIPRSPITVRNKRSLSLCSSKGRQTPVERCGSKKSRHRRQINNATNVGATEDELVYHRLAGQLSAAFANKLGWTEKGLIWFAFGQRGVNSSMLEANILLGDKFAYGLSTSGQGVDMTTLLKATANTFSNGGLNGITLGGQRVQLMTLTSCEDANCQRQAFIVEAPPNSGSDVIRASLPWLILLVLVDLTV